MLHFQFDCLKQSVVDKIPSLLRLYIFGMRELNIARRDLCSPESLEVEVLNSWTEGGSALEMLKFQRHDPFGRPERACMWRSIPGPILRCWQHFWADPEERVFA